jgi:serine/threonine-protein kinase
VPAIASGAAAGDDMTQLLGATDTSAATRLLPGAAAAGVITSTSSLTAVEDEPQKRKRSPWTWPLIALIALLLLVLGGTLWAIFANNGGPEPDPTASSPSPTRTTASATPTETQTLIDIDALALTGQQCDAASAKAKEAGVDAVNCTAGNAAPSADQVGQVYQVSPSGRIPASQLLTLTYYGDQTPLTAPTAPTIGTPVAPGETVQVTWTGYSCPSGTGSPSAYNFTATRGQFANGQSTSSFPADARSAPLTVTGADGETVIVTYTVDCTGNNEKRTSPASPEANAQIQAAPTPTPTP